MTNGFDRLRGKVRQWRQYRHTVRELSQLSARELDDLGISRYDIDRVARKAASTNL